MKTRIHKSWRSRRSLLLLVPDMHGTMEGRVRTRNAGCKSTPSRSKQDGNGTSRPEPQVEREGRKALKPVLKEGQSRRRRGDFVEPLEISGGQNFALLTREKFGQRIKFTRKLGNFGSPKPTA
jgi:hypothetical protein